MRVQYELVCVHDVNVALGIRGLKPTATLSQDEQNCAIQVEAVGHPPQTRWENPLSACAPPSMFATLRVAELTVAGHGAGEARARSSDPT